MKNKHKRLIMQKYPWYDSSSLLSMIELWCTESAKAYKTKGVCVNSDKVARELSIVAHLCKRINADDYSDPHWFGNVTIDSDFYTTKPTRVVRFTYRPNKKIYRMCMKRREKQKQADLDMLTRLINRNLFGWWD